MKVLPHEAQEQFYGGFGLFVKCVKQGHGTQVTVIVCEPFVCQRCFQKKNKCSKFDILFENCSYEYTAKYKTLEMIRNLHQLYYKYG